ncbi:hypothetical protein F5Y15DRAFT_384075 [Xylariaceae sp. FL0016]|nr:hypothetical protein F5Y15DRAFT_384075 [Xylariaceae sp. FL0016]
MLNVPPNQDPKWTSEIIPQPTQGAGGTASISYSAHIAASPVTCMEVMLDASTFPTWNKWIPKVNMMAPAENPAASTPASLAHLTATRPEQMLLRGAAFEFEVHMDPDSPKVHRSQFVVSVLEEFEHEGRKGLRVAWKQPGSPWLLRSERTQEFLEGVEGGTDYVSAETFKGPLAWLVTTMVGSQLCTGFALWRDGLKKMAEEREREREKSKIAT